MTYKEYRKLEDAVQELLDKQHKYYGAVSSIREGVRQGKMLGYIDVLDMLRRDFNPWGKE